jgi:succinate-semialdehyde dehydrogenase / glutarate-semialdehyde dehydrogenase
VIDNVPKDLLIGGKAISTEKRVPVEDPATGEPLAEVADASPEQGLDALGAAADAQAGWAATDPRERGEILRRAFELIMERADDIALLMTLEMGKPLAEARTEVTYGAEFLRWFSEEAARIAGRYSIAPSGGTRLLTMKQPVGPVYAITPWNFPLAMGTRKIGPALAAGCTVVIKPASQTPLTTLALAAILAEAGVPDGVLNVITSSSSGPVSEPIITDPRLRKLTFTGSTAVGQKLIEQSAHQVLRISMELGGNAPFLVFADADLDAAIDGAMLAKMRNIGEACTAANRFIVHESVAEEFAARFATRMSELRIGRGTDDGVQVGPLIDQAAIDKITELVDDAVDSGAEVITGGEPVGGKGHFYPPTVLKGVPARCRIVHEEIFGPVAPITSFGSDDEGLALANDTEFGLVAYAYTQDLSRAVWVAEGLETGMVGLNQGIVSNPAAPFGGVKHSGIGREGGREGIEEYLETKYVGIKL